MLKKTNSAKKTFSEYTKIAWLIATSQHVLLDDFYPLVYPLKIRNNVNLIQVWHAVGAFKTFGFSRMGLPGGPKPTSKNHKNYTWAIVSSKHVAPFYAEGFGIDDRKVLPLGAPRTDMFFDTSYKQSVVTRLEEELPFIKGKKVVLLHQLSAVMDKGRRTTTLIGLILKSYILSYLQLGMSCCLRFIPS